MKPNRLFIIIAFIFTLFPEVFGQVIQGEAANERVKGASLIRYNSKNQHIEQIVFNDKVQSLIELDSLMKIVFHSRSEDTWVELKKETDQIGMEHLRFQQLYKGIPVENGIVIVHAKNNFIQSINGAYFPELNFSITPSITEAAGWQTVLLKENLTFSDLHYKVSNLLVYSSLRESQLAYKFSIVADSVLLNKDIYVSASSGKIIFENSKVCSIDVNGTAHTQFSGVKTVTVNQVSSNQYTSIETTRGNGIQTFNAISFLPYTDSDNNWNNVNANLDEYAMDVHFGAEATYDFYNNHFNRNSYDNSGGLLLNYANDPVVGFNAYWSGFPDNEMHYGNGNSTHFPVASLEVVGHEMTHGVTEYSSGLIYSGESGALNESFSDIFGVTLRFLNAPTLATWYIGDQLLHPNAPGPIAFRNLANPNQFGNADCYNGLYFNAGDIVHFDSGIQNFWYYLLCTGGSGMNDIGNSYSVTAIGMNDAMHIAYRNLAYYLTPSSTFMDARIGSEQAAIDLFGICSPQHLEVIHAWYAVGVGSNFSSFEANANFTITDTFSCTAPFTTSFNANNGYVYFWDFGDGVTSTLEDPTHTYTSTGTFDVSLIAFSSNTCATYDTMLITNAITINPTLPVANFTSSNLIVGMNAIFTDATQYNATSWFWDFGDGTTSVIQHPTHTYTNEGLYNVTLISSNCAGSDTIYQTVEVYEPLILCQDIFTNKPNGVFYDSGGANWQYQDNELCELLIQPCNADFIQLFFEEFDIENQFDNLYVYDGSSTSDPLLATLTGSFNNLPLTITSSGGSMLIRFQSDFSVNNSGFKIKYISTSIGGGNASFTVNDLSPVVGQQLTFNDNSTINPISWSWDFGDGTTSTLENPTHTYPSNGTYTISLIVQFCDNTIDTALLVLEIGTNSIAENELNGSVISVFPVPTSDRFTVTSTHQWSDISIQLLDLSGRVVMDTFNAGIVENELVINAQEILPGQYVLTVSFTDGQQQQQLSRSIIQKL